MNDYTDGARVDAGGMVSEGEMPSLSDFAGEPGGAWPKGWYKATIIEGYATRNGHTFTLEDSPSKQGDSRNLRITLSIAGPLGERNTFTSLNYRVGDFTPDLLAAIKAARAEFAGAQGRWGGAADIQRSSLAVAALGQLEKAIGFKFSRHPEGHILTTTLLGQQVDVRLGVDDDGYNKVTAFAAAGTRTGGKK